jgi:hypothetical protein
VEEYGRGRQATDDNISHALCMLHDYGRKHTLSICNIYCFSTATTVTLTRLNVTFISTLLVMFHLKLLLSLAFRVKEVCLPWMATHIIRQQKR